MLANDSYWTKVLNVRIRRRRAIFAGSAAVVGSAFLAACGGSDSSDSTGSGNGRDGGLVSEPVDTTSKAVKGGVLTLEGGEPNSFDFTAGSGAPNYGVHAYSRLVKYETFKYPDPAVAKAAPDAALSWEVSPDGLTYTYKLRQGMKFDPRPPTNGREMTTDDVTFSWNRFATKSSFRSTMVNSIDPEAPVVSVTAPDKSTVVAKLAFPFGPFNIYFGYYRYGQIMPVESD
ncbi:MAG TPA: ABC transporter substrate-binding protein, partial [Dehalococcoidia bacterium]|nr:ABC transporter substrate-binding protein [Dehalococcoidia bacterium]